MLCEAPGQAASRSTSQAARRVYPLKFRAMAPNASSVAPSFPWGSQFLYPFQPFPVPLLRRVRQCGLYAIVAREMDVIGRAIRLLVRMLPHSLRRNGQRALRRGMLLTIARPLQYQASPQASPGEFPSAIITRLQAGVKTANGCWKVRTARIAKRAKDKRQGG